MKKKTIWYLVTALVLGIALLAVACAGSAEETPAKPATPAAPVTPVVPATPVAPVTPVTPVTPAAPVAPVTPAVPAAPVATPPKAPKALHEALFAATPPGCTACHTVGGAGVGAAGGTGLPGPGSVSDHTGRTADICKGCHQLSS